MSADRPTRKEPDRKQPEDPDKPPSVPPPAPRPAPVQDPPPPDRPTGPYIAMTAPQKATLRRIRAVRGSVGCVWMSARPSGDSPGSRET